MNDPISPTVLLLEDEALIALDLEGSLTDAGFTVASFGTCRDGAAWLQSNTPDVAVLDIHLVDGSCSDIAQLLSGRSIPFIVHTGEVEADHWDTVFAAGSWLPKPASTDDVASLAKSLVDSAAMGTESYSGA